MLERDTQRGDRKYLRTTQTKAAYRQGSRNFINQFWLIKQVANRWYMLSDMCNYALVSFSSQIKPKHGKLISYHYAASYPNDQHYQNSM